ncbi:phosphatidate cytidylyltransferase [Cereibacter sphaeroides]|uniref:phosphatidate cytidylyltransferase n=1 Tax=Rhodobacterales TaxID=204455 RepID=UPI000BBE2C77|nr:MULTISPECIES: phosphatidate cytidylyltransferase [Paracoccaceae]MCE6953190.1 phosphatidate cytidylyltransferase [Cereibacter sphaeroides]MCE6961709.1 phosphatidate cytidylyltransferase [Cereibacter sphaeroides]MCE6970485.1 phosphatidate cytidylyltransferase [Cereibacter sphaeroides]MCE6975059.1 phosphatidate cytidylyltransferase [Cereibacter sphaeroides]
MSRPEKPKGRWGDLRRRMISAAIMLAVGGVEVWLGGVPFALMVIALTGLMMWELARMTAPARPLANILLGLLASGVLMGVLGLVFQGDMPLALIGLVVPPAVGLIGARRDRRIFFTYATALMAAGAALVTLREEGGSAAIVWLILVVVASDVLGYFAGRSLGGPKFWPAVSPNKTWSGTVAGWLGAAIVGLGFSIMAGAGWGLIILSPVIALAGQLGDIVESWIKRRSGVKDSSSLIPGHGGVLDRFDALTGAVLAVLVLGLLGPLPLPEMGN